MPANEEQREITRRWLVALDFVLAAENHARRGPEVEYGIAAALADAACETILGILATFASEPLPEQPTYARLLQGAAEGVGKQRLGVGRRQRLLELHRHRNQVLHHGAETDRRRAERSVLLARELFDVLADALEFLPPLPLEGGLARGVAALVESASPEVAHCLRRAEDSLATENAEAAADWACYAFYLALYRTTPQIAFQSELRSIGRANPAAWERERIKAHERWLVPLALGMSPREYQDMAVVLGEPTGLAYIVHPTISRKEAPDIDAVRGVLGRVASVVYRLWEMDAFRRGVTGGYLWLAAIGEIPDTLKGLSEPRAAQWKSAAEHLRQRKKREQPDETVPPEPGLE